MLLLIPTTMVHTTCSALCKLILEEVRSVHSSVDKMQGEVHTLMLWAISPPPPWSPPSPGMPPVPPEDPPMLSPPSIPKQAFLSPPHEYNENLVTAEIIMIYVVAFVVVIVCLAASTPRTTTLH